MNTSKDLELDLREYTWPVLVHKVSKGLEQIAIGQTLTFITEDVERKVELSGYLKEAGHEIVETKDQGDSIIYVIRKKK